MDGRTLTRSVCRRNKELTVDAILRQLRSPGTGRRLGALVAAATAALAIAASPAPANYSQQVDEGSGRGGACVGFEYSDDPEDNELAADACPIVTTGR